MVNSLEKKLQQIGEAKNLLEKLRAVKSIDELDAPSHDLCKTSYERLKQLLNEGVSKEDIGLDQVNPSVDSELTRFNDL